MRNYKIAVAGTGYVGLSLGVLLSQHHQVVAVDIVQAKVDMINNKKSPIQDDYIEKYLAEKDLNLTATLDAKAAWASLRPRQSSCLPILIWLCALLTSTSWTPMQRARALTLSRSSTESASILASAATTITRLLVTGSVK